jgi:hypothetical protein
VAEPTGGKTRLLVGGLDAVAASEKPPCGRTARDGLRKIPGPGEGAGDVRLGGLTDTGERVIPLSALRSFEGFKLTKIGRAEARKSG